MADMTALEKRLNKFEEKIDSIHSTLVQMARTEERVSIILEQTTELIKKQDKLNERVSHLEKENATQGQSLGFFERASWIVAGAIASIATWFITK